MADYIYRDEIDLNDFDPNILIILNGGMIDFPNWIMDAAMLEGI